MKFADLSQYPEYASLLDHVKWLVDSAADRVLNAARNGQHAEVQRASGRHDALNELYKSLIGKD